MSDARAPGGLEEIRERIAVTDQQLVHLIAARVALARQAGHIKRQHGVPTLDPPREAAVVTRATEHARALGLHEEDVRQIFWQIVGMCRRAQAGES